MLRWNRELQKEASNAQIDAFIADIVAVSKAHGMSISHEDTNGAFVIQKYSDFNIAWMEDAFDDTAAAPAEAPIICG